MWAETLKGHLDGILLAPLPVAAAAVASLVRLLLASRAAHRCLVLRASLA